MPGLAFAAALFGIATILVAMLVGPLLSHPDYSSISHSTSALAGQKMPNAWIMRAGLGGYGAATAFAALVTVTRAPAVKIALALFGAGLIGTAIWPHLPIDPALGSDLHLDRLHSWAANLTGFAFAVACLSRLAQAGFPRADHLAWAGMAASVAIPQAMSVFPGVEGALQRLMFAVSFLFVAREFRPV